MTAVHDFASAEEYLSGGRRKTDRPIENNTRVVRLDDDRIGVRLHNTDVVTFHRNGTTELTTGGWLTVTTKDRINRYAFPGWNRGLRIGSDRGRWFVYALPGWRKVTRFFDGIKIRGDEILNAVPAEKEERQTKAEDAMVKRITKYLDGYMKALAEGMPRPGGGDCWDCSFVTDDGKSMGDLKDDGVHGHLFSHMTERYYVPTLIWNAVRDRRYGNYQFVMGTRLDTEAFEQGTQRVRRGWNSDEPDKYAMKNLRHDLRKYLMKRLLPSRAH